MKNEIKKINDFQQQMYEDYEKETAVSLVTRYSDLLETFKEKDHIKILDIGGASGYFASALLNYFGEKTCQVFVVDSTKYSTWNNGDAGAGGGDNQAVNRVVFVEDSAENLEKHFSENTFDLIFANRVFHHFVNKTWKKSLKSISDSMGQISRVLKPDGCFCITDYFYDGHIFDSSASKIIYGLTSCKNPLLVSVFRKIDSKSAGIGVCFLSKKMWFDFFDKNNFIVEQLHEGNRIEHAPFRAFIYKLCLWIKNGQEDVIMILKKT